MKEYECKKAEKILAKHMGGFAKEYEKWLKKMYKVLKDANLKKTWFGDMDTIVELLVDTEEKKVFVLRSTCSCADVTKFLIVWETNCLKTDIHVRELNDKSDYPRKQYPDKLGLKFYKDRDFVIDYVEKHHMTKLGGVYGDIRDHGYIISYEIYNPMKIAKSDEFFRTYIKDQFHIAHFYQKWRHFTFYLNTTDIELDEILAGKREVKE